MCVGRLGGQKAGREDRKLKVGWEGGQRIRELGGGEVDAG